jgi:hypothetical protein
LEELLHVHTNVTVLAFVTRLMTLKSKFFLSNNCYNELLKLIVDVLLNHNKLPKDMYHSKKLVKGTVWIMRRLVSAKIVVCFFRRNTRTKNNA